MSDELRELAERLDERTVDWNGARMVDGEPPRIVPTCAEMRAAAAAILALLKDRDEDDKILRQSVPEEYKHATSPVGCVQNYIVSLETRLARAVEGLREAKGAIDVAEIVGARNAAGYLTDRALWAQCAIDKINHILSEVTDDAG